MASRVLRVSLLPGEMTSTVIRLSLPFWSSVWRSVGSCWSGETMVMCDVDLALPLVMTEPAMPPPMSNGMRMVEMRKALVRTRSRYSRFAMSQTLCIDFASVNRFPGFCCYFFDKDLFEGGFHDFEAGNAGLGDGLGEEGLAVVCVAELDLGAALVVFCLVDGGVVYEGGCGLSVYDDAVVGIAGLDLAHGSGEDEAAVVDEADGVAELLDLVRAVGGEEDGGALVAEVDEGGLQERGVD